MTNQLSLLSIKSLFIDGFRNFSNFQIEFDKKLNVLVGPNGVGKSSIFEVFRYFLDKSMLYYDRFDKETTDAIVILEFFPSRMAGRLYDLTKTARFFEIVRQTSIDSFSNIKNYVFNVSTDDRWKLNSVDPNILLNKQVSIYTSIYRVAGSKDSISHDFLESDGQLFWLSGSSSYELRSHYENKYLDFNQTDYKGLLVKKFESEGDFRRYFSYVKVDATKRLNKKFNSQTQKLKYVSDPEMRVNVVGQEGREIEKLSEGEKRIESLDLFCQVAESFEARVAVVDEPELHLNQGQLPFLTEVVTRLTNKCQQVFIATHSPYFLRFTNLKNIRFIKFDDGNPIQKILSLNKFRNILNYPELFFAEKIVIVEALTDKFFFERVIDLILKDRKKLNLSSRNVFVIASYGKDNIKSIFEFASFHLQIPVYIISDLDFICNEATYGFLGNTTRNALRRLLKNRLSVDKSVSGEKIISLSKSEKSELLDFFDSVFSRNYISKSDKIKFRQYREIFLTKRYTETPFSRVVLKIVKMLLLKDKVWLLDRKIESYCEDKLKEGGHLSIDKLYRCFYPTNRRELIDFVKVGKMSELEKLALHVGSWADLF